MRSRSSARSSSRGSAAKGTNANSPMMLILAARGRNVACTPTKRAQVRSNSNQGRVLFRSSHSNSGELKTSNSGNMYVHWKSSLFMAHLLRPNHTHIFFTIPLAIPAALKSLNSGIIAIVVGIATTIPILTGIGPNPDSNTNTY